MTPFPATEELLYSFVASLFRAGMAGTSVKGYLATIRYTQIALGQGDPGMGDWPRLGYVVRGFKKKTRAGAGRPRHPITMSILRQSKGIWEGLEDRHKGRILWAVACLCFFGFLRTGEAVVPSQRSYDPQWHRSMGDVRLDNHDWPSFLEVHIKYSKTDVFWKVRGSILGQRGNELCPVAAILDYMAQPEFVAPKHPHPHSSGSGMARN